jgi:catechol-2,3-dioxygenase
MQITELQLITRDLGALRAFYTEGLCLPLLAAAPDSFSVQAGATRLTFSADATRAATYHFAFNIPENKLPAAKAWLSGRADLLTQDGADEFASQTWNAQQVYFYDPAGNILEFIARHNLTNAAAGPFGPHDILEVSEIGLPVGVVPTTVALLTRDLGLPPFQDQGDTFSPIGDDHGLFIVVRRGRHWFPTERAADLHPLAVTIAGPQARRYNLPDLPYAIEVAIP